jgi:HK97 family phage major capsid protein
MIETKEQIEGQMAQIRQEILSRIGEQKTLSETTASTVVAMQKQLDALDLKLQGTHGIGGGSFGKSLLEYLKEEPSFERLIKDRKGTARLVLHGSDAQLLERKTTITSDVTGRMTSGVVPIERLPGITLEARQQLFLRNLLQATPTGFQVLDFVKVNQPAAIASPVGEASTKPENTITFVSVSERVKTIATWIPASRQILDDMTELGNAIQSELSYATDLAEELQMLSGDGTGENLHGLIPQASSFNTGLLSASKGWNKLEIIGRAMQQIAAAKEVPPTFVVMHPNDWYDIRLLRDSQGRYVLGNPGELIAPVLFGLQVLSTVNISAGTFLVGSSSPTATEIRDRMELMVEASTEHQDFFIKNLVAIRAEKRLALITRRPASFVTGSFTTSP